VSLFSVIKMVKSMGAILKLIKLLQHPRDRCHHKCHGQTWSDVLRGRNVTASRDCSPEQMRGLSACRCDECELWKTQYTRVYIFKRNHSPFGFYQKTEAGYKGRFTLYDTTRRDKNPPHSHLPSVNRDDMHRQSQTGKISFCREVDHALPLLRLRINGAVPVLPHTSSWLTQGQIYVFFYPCLTRTKRMFPANSLTLSSGRKCKG
jgi:hypothetical protein